jgi:hypothetical protein
MSKVVIINHKKYTVMAMFNMVLNYGFIDKNGAIYLVDGEDVQGWEDGDGTASIDNAIAYAKYYAANIDGGVFWWKVNNV